MNTDIKNYTICQEALQLKDNIEGAYLKLGELLSRIRSQRLYQPTHDTFPEFLMEMDITEGTASKMITVYDLFIGKYQIPEQMLIDAKGWSKVYAIAKVSDTKEHALEWLERASIASRQHLTQDIREKETGLTPENCEHDYYTLNVCKKCGDKFVG
jgi:hypothetical protein